MSFKTGTRMHTKCTTWPWWVYTKECQRLPANQQKRGEKILPPRSQKEPVLWTPSSQTSSPQNWETENVYCVSWPALLSSLMAALGYYYTGWIIASPMFQLPSAIPCRLFTTAKELPPLQFSKSSFKLLSPSSPFLCIYSPQLEKSVFTHF